MNHDLPLLGAIAGFLRWIEELTVLLSVPLLTLGLGISLVDLLTGGTLLQSTPWLAYLWAISQAVGIEGQLAGAAYNIRNAFTKRAFFAMGGYVCLTISLAYVAFLAAQAFTLHESGNLNVSTALSLIGIDSVSWAWQRAIIAVALVVLGSLLRYRPMKIQAADEAQRLREQIELAPLRAQAQAAKVMGARAVVRAAVKGDAAPATQPLTPAEPERASDPYMTAVDTPDGAYLTIVQQPPKSRKRSAKPTPRGAKTWEHLARVAWDNGARSVRQLERAVKNADGESISHTAAQYWAGVLRAEERGAEQARKEA